MDSITTRHQQCSGFKVLSVILFNPSETYQLKVTPVQNPTLQQLQPIRREGCFPGSCVQVKNAIFDVLGHRSGEDARPDQDIDMRFCHCKVANLERKSCTLRKTISVSTSTCDFKTDSHLTCCCSMLNTPGHDRSAWRCRALRPSTSSASGSAPLPPLRSCY